MDAKAIIESKPAGKKASKKVKREIANVLNRDFRTRNKLLGMNPYGQSLLDPFNYRCVRIPDDQQFESIPFSVVDRRTLSVNAQLIAGICYGLVSSPSAVAKGSLIPINILGDATNSYAIGMIFGSAATTTDLTAGTVGTTGVAAIKLQSWQNASPAVPNLFDKVRLVSAGVNVQCTGNFTKNSGKYTAAFAPRNYSRLQAGGVFSLAYLQNLPSSVTAPVSLERGITVKYKPLDDVSREYVTIGTNQNTGGQSGPLYTVAASVDWDQYKGLQAANGSELWVAVDGCDSGATFLVTAVFNYEGIPAVNNVLLSPMMTGAAETSIYDPIALAHAQNLVAKVPTVVASSAMANGSAAHELSNLPNNIDMSPKNQGYSMFDSLLNVLEKAPQFLDAVPGIVEKGSAAVDSLSPLLESALAFL